ncbi:MAG: three-Cys-motif partner protein TcmP [Nannocystis sp.]|nr:three-Cys-motif partner protein TcmP [Nannocystis sp.]MBA3546176.1 three-Cys-motif partner protein TcmP [Nannocystis sp.]
MSHGGYEWSTGDAPPIIGDHSIAKHEVLHAYLLIYVDVLTSYPGMDGLRLTLVDGFAGGGKYTHPRDKSEHDGSPLIMLRAMEEAEFRAQERRKKNFALDARFFFVESQGPTFSYLKNTIENPDFANKFKSKASLIHSTFENAAPKIVTSIQGGGGRVHRCIFLLDQYGWSDVTLDTVRMVLKELPGAEILLTFSVDKMINFLSEQGVPTLNRTGLSEIAKAVPTLKTLPAKRRFLQRLLTEELTKRCGATFYTPFFIRPSTASNNDYWFVHLSNHARARDEMAKLHWGLQNHFVHHGEPGLMMLGYDPRKDDAYHGQGSLFDFSNDAETLTKNTLREQLPRRINAIWPKGASFDKIFQTLCNETPATKDIIRQVVRDCISERELDLFSGKTTRSRRPDVQHIADNDVIVFSRQLRFFIKPQG